MMQSHLIKILVFHMIDVGCCAAVGNSNTSTYHSSTCNCAVYYSNLRGERQQVGRKVTTPLASFCTSSSHFFYSFILLIPLYPFSLANRNR